MDKRSCQLANWCDQSKEVKHYLRQNGWAMMTNDKVQAGNLDITNPVVMSLVAAADSVRQALVAAGHDCGDLGPLGYHLNIFSMLLNPDPLVRARAACVAQVWADDAGELRSVAVQMPLLSPAGIAALHVGQRMTLGDASKAVGGAASPLYSQPLPAWPLGPAVLTQRLLVTIVDVGQMCLEYGIGLWTGGKYFVHRVNAMAPDAKLRFGAALAALHGTEAAEVAHVTSLLASGGIAAVRRLMCSLDASTGAWGWNPVYLPGPAPVAAVVAPGVAEAFVQRGDWLGRSRLRLGSRAVPTLAAAILPLGGPPGAGETATVKVAYSLCCDDGGVMGGPIRQALTMVLADAIRPLGVRAVQRESRGWATSEATGMDWKSAPWTVSIPACWVPSLHPSSLSSSLYSPLCPPLYCVIVVIWDQW